MDKNVSRKEFFRLALDNAKGLAADLVSGLSAAAEVWEESADKKKHPPEKLRFVRPPGALPEEQFLKACTHCGDCAVACPHWAIRRAGPEHGKGVALTIVIVPQDNPCLMCSDFPCIAACEPGALRMPSDGSLPRLGTAKVAPEACYLVRNQPCDYCMVHCPESPKAIDASRPGTLPKVDPAACTGCGKCAQICPPRAIIIEPFSKASA